MSTTALLSFEEFERIDQGADHIELLKGELIRLPPAYLRHNQRRNRLHKKLDIAVEQVRARYPEVPVGDVYEEMGYLLGTEPRSWLQPDVSITHSNQPGDKYYEGAPLMVFEIISEFDSARDVDAKVAEYLANGAAEVWVLYPDRKHALVYEASPRAVRQETEAIRSKLLPGIEIPFAEIF
jgi:Uma2 family endonuclease